jgi:hypothetical protein
MHLTQNRVLAYALNMKRGIKIGLMITTAIMVLAALAWYVRFIVRAY